MLRKSIGNAAILWVGLAVVGSALGQNPPPRPDINYEEDKVGNIPLPDPLVMLDGRKVENASAWREGRRPEVLRLFSALMYGKTPETRVKTTYELLSEESRALGGKATRREVSIRFGDKPDGPAMTLLLFTPNDAKGRVPAFLGLNFGGNHAVHPDPGIRLSSGWFRNNPQKGYVENKATEATRGTEASRWPVETIIGRGYALATAYYGDLDPDFDDGFRNGVHPLFYRPGQTRPGPDEWGSIGAWAWGLSRALDYLETEPAIDAKRVAVTGHSRLGKTSLWAGAQDERFALVVSNDSGEGGAALARRWYGETIRRINTAFPHWFCDNYKGYNDRVEDLPFDQHMLITLVAPRPVLVCSAEDDKWADPKGEFLGALNASPVYKLLGLEGIATGEMPAVNTPVGKAVGYQIRPGPHDVTDVDWKAYLDFADRHLAK